MGKNQTLEDTNNIWEQIKEAEKTQKVEQSFFADIPLAFPAVLRAQKVSEKAKKIGFDWADKDQVRNLIRHELEELDQAVEEDNQAKIAEEIGDCLFSLIQIARHFELDAESVLNSSTKKFIDRVELACSIAEREGCEIRDLTEKRREKIWVIVKEILRKEGK